jgi:hypothetical protein
MNDEEDYNVCGRIEQTARCPHSCQVRAANSVAMSGFYLEYDLASNVSTFAQLVRPAGFGQG